MQNLVKQTEWFRYLAKVHNFWPIVLYSKSLNVVISTICKNGSCAIENWAAKDTDFQLVESTNNADIFSSTACPIVISVIRDPVERAISAINMLQIQHRSFGLSVTWENYTNIEYTNDMHLMPQSAQIPTESSLDNITLEDLMMWDYTHPSKYFRGWEDVLQEYQPISRLTDINKFFFIREGGHDITKDIAAYLNLPHSEEYSGSNNAETYTKKKPQVSDEYRGYLRKIYAHDYKLIDAVTFINKYWENT